MRRGHASPRAGRLPAAGLVAKPVCDAPAGTAQRRRRRAAVLSGGNETALSSPGFHVIFIELPPSRLMALISSAHLNGFEN